MPWTATVRIIRTAAEKRVPRGFIARLSECSTYSIRRDQVEAKKSTSGWNADYFAAAVPWTLDFRRPVSKPSGFAQVTAVTSPKHVLYTISGVGNVSTR